jgi:arabinofuranan 3-O-arabinosyltransferase
MRTPLTQLRARWTDQAGASLLVYGIVSLFIFLEQFGLTTTDTNPALIEEPGRFLKGALQLWDSSHNFGELQNQAYGYLFPQGPFFLLADAAHLSPWIAERLWTVLLIVVGCEGARLVGRSMGLAPWPAWIAGLAYGLNPRTIGELTTRSAEILPTVVLPWVALPVLLAITGRIGARRAAVLSAAAFLCAGAANATATLAILPFVLVLLAWAIRTRRASWRLLGWWAALMAIANAWWIAALLVTMPFTPDFFDYVEDAPLTTRTAGFNAALRGMSNWVGYTFAGGKPTWPAGAMLAFNPALVLATGVLAAIGAYGMATFHRPWRTPLVISGTVGLVLVTVAHADSVFTSPLAPSLVTLLDGPLAVLRNVSKADPSLRLPLALGVGMVLAKVLQRVPPTGRGRAQAGRQLGVAAVVLLALSPLTPVWAHQPRTPVWEGIPD